MAYDAESISEKIDRITTDALIDLEMGRKVDVSIYITNENIDITQRIPLTGLVPVAREMEFAPAPASEVARDPNEP